MDLPIIPRDSFFSRGAMLKTATIGSRGQLELCKDFPQQFVAMKAVFTKFTREVTPGRSVFCF